MDDRKDLLKARLAIFGGVAFVVIVIVASVIGMMAQSEQKKAAEKAAGGSESMSKPTDEVIATGAQDSFYALMGYLLYGEKEGDAHHEQYDIMKFNDYYYNSIAIKRGDAAKKYTELTDAFLREYDEAKLDEIKYDRRTDYMNSLKNTLRDVEIIFNEMPNYSKDYLYSYYSANGVDATAKKITDGYVKYTNNADSRVIAGYAGTASERDGSFLGALKLLEGKGCIRVSSSNWHEGSTELKFDDAIKCGKDKGIGDKINSIVTAYDSYDERLTTHVRHALLDATNTMFTIRDALEELR